IHRSQPLPADYGHQDVTSGDGFLKHLPEVTSQRDGIDVHEHIFRTVTSNKLVVNPPSDLGNISAPVGDEYLHHSPDHKHKLTDSEPGTAISGDETNRTALVFRAGASDRSARFSLVDRG